MKVPSRVVMGFGPITSMTLNGSAAEVGGVAEAGTSFWVRGVGDVVPAIEAARNSEPVLADAVSESNIADETIDPIKAFSIASPPLDASRGGTGLSGFARGSIAVTGDYASGCSAEGGKLVLESGMSVGSWRFSPVTDALGARALVAVDDATGESVDITRPRRGLPAPVLVASAAFPGTFAIEASGFDISARICHLYWTSAPGPVPSVARVALGASASVMIGRDRTARHAATGLRVPGTYNVYAVAEGLRRSFSAVASAPSNSAGAIFIEGDFLDPRVSFSRATVATRVNSAGLVEIAPANAPRIDHDPVTLAPKGLLVEEARTNLFVNSEALSGAIANTEILQNDSVSPAGTMTAERIITSDASQVSTLRSRRVWSASTTYTLSFYAKSAGQNAVYFHFNHSGLLMYANLQTGETALKPLGSPGVSTTSAAFGNGWYRFSVSFAVGGVQQTADMDFGGTNSFGMATLDGIGESGVLLWGVQLEVGGFATSYIPTGASAVTRAGDFASIAVQPDWYNPIQGTFGAQFQTQYTGATTPLRDVLSGDGLLNTYMRIIYLVSGSTGVGSTDNARNLLATGTATGELVKVFTSYSSTLGRAMSVGGNAVMKRTELFPVQGYPAQNTLFIGGTSSELSNPGKQVCGWIRSLVYYSTRLPDADLMSLSADD